VLLDVIGITVYLFTLRTVTLGCQVPKVISFTNICPKRDAASRKPLVAREISLDKKILSDGLKSVIRP
jgi:hypothetical protein